MLGKDFKSFAFLKKKYNTVSEKEIIKDLIIAKDYGIDNYAANGYNDNVINSMYDIAKTVVSNKGVAAANTTELFGSLSGSEKWYGGVLAPNGKIYGIPANSTQVLCVDPETHTTELFGNLTGSGKWYGGVLAPNGKIYGIPGQSNQILCIDPETHTTELSGDLSGAYKWHGGALASNGKIYCIPCVSTQILCIDPGCPNNFKMETLLSPLTNMDF